MNSKKAISPVIATSLFLVIAIVSVIGFQSWFNTYQAGLNVKVEDNSNDISNLEIIDMVGNEIYIKSSNSNIQLDYLKIDKTICEINNKSLSQGITKVEHSCLLDSGEVDLLLVSNRGIISKQAYVKDDMDITDLSNLKIWFDFSDISTMYLDTNATTPATSEGQQIALIYDKSGNNLNASMNVSSQRPTLRKDSNNEYYLEFDGINDSLVIYDLTLLEFIQNNRSFSTYISYLNQSSGSNHILAFGSCCANYLAFKSAAYFAFMDNRGYNDSYSVSINLNLSKTVASLRLNDSGYIIINDYFNQNLHNYTWSNHSFGSTTTDMSIGSYQNYAYAEINLKEVLWYAEYLSNETNNKIFERLY